MTSIAPILLLVLLAAGVQDGPAGTWREVLAGLESRRDELAEHLGTAHEVLVARARVEDPGLLERLSPEPPKPRRHGWGILPEVRPDGPLQAIQLREQRYSLEALRKGFGGDFRDATVLAQRCASGALEPLVMGYERLEKRMRNLEEHLSYHAWWQEAVEEQAAFFAERNQVMAQVRQMQALQSSGSDPERAAALAAEVRVQVARFRPTPGLRIETRAGGLLVLPVIVTTDIDDEGFLAAFRQGVEAAFVRSQAAQARHFAVELRIRAVQPYPENRPAHGAVIDMDDHLTRFPARSLVLTTGAKSTQAWQGRSILLGPSPVTRRTLAHEFGHLLGFGDAYLRAFDGSAGDPHGVVLVEWQGLIDDLMGNPAGGRVSEAMIDELLEAYGSPRGEAGAPGP